MKKTTGNLPFEQQSAGKLLLTMCLPAVIIMVVMTVYHMTDLFFIGQLGDVTQLAAVSLVSPAIGIQSVFGTLIGAADAQSSQDGWVKKKEANGKLQAAACCCRWPAADCTQRYCWQVSDSCSPFSASRNRPLRLPASTSPSPRYPPRQSSFRPRLETSSGRKERPASR